MKIVRILSVHYLKILCDSIFDTTPTELKYDDIISIFRENRVLHPNFLPEALYSLGYEVFDFIIDLPKIHHFWTHSTNPHTALVQFILHHKPEIVYFERASIEFVPEEIKKKIREIPSVHLVSGYWGAQLSSRLHSKTFKHIDHLFSIDETLTEQLQKYVPKTTMLRSSFDGKKSTLPDFSQRFRDLAFFGTSGYGFADHQIRFHMLRSLCKNVPIEMWCDEPKRDLRGGLRFALVKKASFLPIKFLEFFAYKSNFKQKFFIDALSFLRGENLMPWHLKFIPLKEEFPQIVNSPVHGVEYEKKIKETKIVFNCHVDNPLLYGNMRTYEVTGLGALLLTDRAEKMKNLFVPDEEIVTYSSIEEAKEKIAFLYNHPKEMERIAKKGHEKTMKEHTIFKRAEKMAEVFQKLLNK